MNTHEQLIALTGIEDPVIGFADAHPDDILMQANLVHHARLHTMPMHEIVLTRGERGINLSGDLDVSSGGRQTEGEATARYFDLATYEQHDFGDGRLLEQAVDHRSKQQLTAVMTDWIVTRQINMLAVSTTADHEDHITSVYLGTEAAYGLATQGYDITVINLQPKGRQVPELHVSLPANEESVAAVLGAAAINRSQFQIAHGNQIEQYSEEYGAGAMAWPIVGGHFIEPGSLRRLSQYPIRQTARYTLASPWAATRQGYGQLYPAA